MRVAAIVLAAGESRRMGRPKQTLSFGDSTVIGAVVGALQASQVSFTTVVLGYHSEEVREALAGMEVDTTINPAPEQGMLSSAQWGLSHLPDTYDAYLFALGDQPGLQPDIISALMAAAMSGHGIILPTHGGKRGHPLIIRARYREEILALSLTGGLNQLLECHPDDISLVPVESPSIHEDIDTPEDYDRAIRPRTAC
jgi:molybdenum cofactor cytidylyltransferase